MSVNVNGYSIESFVGNPYIIVTRNDTEVFQSDNFQDCVEYAENH